MVNLKKNLIQYEGIDGCNYTNGNFKKTTTGNTFCTPINKLIIIEEINIKNKYIALDVDAKIY